ncbi:MAG: hypothetical protein KYX62_02560 [Pseudomonadota bacterium]|nr:hypothetical protein [Pseudomonadota bacterium]
MPGKTSRAEQQHTFSSENTLRLIYRAEWLAVALMGICSVILLGLAVR